MHKPLCFVLMPFGRKPAAAGMLVDFDAVYRWAHWPVLAAQTRWAQRPILLPSGRPAPGGCAATTISRCTPNSAAMRRRDQPCSQSLRIALTSAILRLFATLILLLGGPSWSEKSQVSKWLVLKRP